MAQYTEVRREGGVGDGGGGGGEAVDICELVNRAFHSFAMQRARN